MSKARTPSKSIARDGYVFVSYKREEVRVAQAVREQLVRAGFEVWWDEDIQCGQQWSRVLDSKILTASCIVVLWSDQSLASRWVQHEASRAMDRGIYAPARIEMCAIPQPWSHQQATDLMDWDGSPDHPGFVGLLKRVDELVPARPTPLARAGRWLKLRVGTLLAIAFALVSLGVLAWQTTATQHATSQLSGITKQLDMTARDIQRVVHPIESISLEIDGITVPLDDPAMAERRAELDEAIALHLDRREALNTGRPDPFDDEQGFETGGFEQGADGRYRPYWLALSAKHPLAPARPFREPGSHSFEDIVLSVMRAELEFFIDPIDPSAYEPSGVNSRTLQRGDLFLRLSVAPDRGRALRLVKDLRRGEYELDGGMLSSRESWASNGNVVAIPDLAGTQVFLVLGPIRIRGENNEEFKRLRSLYRIGSVRLDFGSRSISLTSEQWTRHSTSERETYWSYTFPDDVDELIGR